MRSSTFFSIARFLAFFAATLMVADPFRADPGLVLAQEASEPVVATNEAAAKPENESADQEIPSAEEATPPEATVAEDAYSNAEETQDDDGDWDGQIPFNMGGEVEEEEEYPDGDEDFDPAQLEEMLLQMFGGDKDKMDRFMKQLETGNFDDDLLAEIMPQLEMNGMGGDQGEV
jgi:hypothetical protein